MKLRFKLLIPPLLLPILLFIQPSLASGELIEPTQTLKQPEKADGRLSVSSEPPGLVVVLDGKEIGNTPVILKRISAGVHKLQVGDSEAEVITIPSGKSLRLSLFKGSLIEIPEKKTVPSPPPVVEKETAVEGKRTENIEKNEKPLDPFYWPLNPGGPIE